MLLHFLATVLLLATVFWSSSLATSVPLCSLPASDRLSALSTLTTSKLAPSSPYVKYAETAYADYIREMYDHTPGRRWLRLQVGSDKPSNYWNTAIALHTLLQYDTFDVNRGGRDRAVLLVQQLVERQRTLNESDPLLRNLYNDDMVRGSALAHAAPLGSAAHLTHPYRHSTVCACCVQSWMMHALTSLYDHTQNSTYLDVATLLFDTVKQSDDTTCCGTWKDGVWWDLAHSSKATAAQAGVTMAALRLRESNATAYSQDYWLEYATHHYWFWRLYMVDNSTGQVCDNINLKGHKTWWSFTYNNGLLLGDAVHLYTATNDSTYVDEARFLAGYLIDSGMNVSVNGTVQRILADDAGNGCSGDVSEFHQVGYQYLTEYYRLLVSLAVRGEVAAGSGSEWVVDEACELYEFLQSNVDSLWQNARHSWNGSVVYDCNWSGSNEGMPGLQGSMNQAVSAFALFADLPVYSVEVGGGGEVRSD